MFKSDWQDYKKSIGWKGRSDINCIEAFDFQIVKRHKKR